MFSKLVWHLNTLSLCSPAFILSNTGHKLWNAGRRAILAFLGSNIHISTYIFAVVLCLEYSISCLSTWTNFMHTWKTKNCIYVLWPHHSIWKFLGQGLNLSGNTRSFNPLCQVGDQTCTSAVTWAAAVRFFFFFFFFFLFRPYLWHMEVPRLGIKLEFCSCSCLPTPQSQQHRILNPLNEARDQTHILMDTSQVHYHWATAGTPAVRFLTHCAMAGTPEKLLYFKFVFALKQWSYVFS